MIVQTGQSYGREDATKHDTGASQRDKRIIEDSPRESQCGKKRRMVQTMTQTQGSMRECKHTPAR
jgi:hypothetical protein